jgi:tetratricopeptide (TPR) repeat protein
MIPLPLSIRYRELPQHAAAAWLVPGEEASLWVEEWLRWNLPQANWQLAILPGWGVLTIVPAGQTPLVPPRAVPLARIGSRWYVPLHAEIVPAVTADELEALLPKDFAAAVFHPARGLLVIETQELRSLQELLAAPPFGAQDWTAAQPGESLNDRLLSVQPGSLPSLAQVLQSGRDDIGSQGSQIKELPPRPNEPGNGLLDRAQRGLSKGFFQAVSGLAGMFGAALPKPGTATGKGAGAGSRGSSQGWLNSLANWAAQKMNAISQQIEDQRNQEIKRLMHLLQNNPDEGLKFAIPFSSGGEHRGVAPPGGSLGLRDVNFSLNRLGGGGPADVWNLSPQYQLQLTQRYRELANRELQLGRHRRAAYIFAELLGDFDAAASALQAGEHWREAAVLYRDRLNRPRQAAECLERGGLLHEAITLFEPLREFEKIGDLYLRLEQKEDAVAAWRKAAGQYEGSRDYFKAAKILEEKIASPEEAEQVLTRCWLDGHFLRESLEKLFDLFTRQQWHDRARARIQSLRDAYNTDTIAIAGSEALATVVRTYPDAQIGAFAADTARVIVGTHLPGADKHIRTRLVTSLQQLAPADLLLARDGQRYLRERDAARPPAPPVSLAPQPTTGKSLKTRSVSLLSEFQLKVNASWEAAVGGGSHFYAIGNAQGTVEVVLFNWQGQGYSAHLNRRLPQGLIVPPQVAVDPQGNGPLLMATGLGKHEIPCEIRTQEGTRRAILFDKADGNAATNARFTRAGLCYALGRAFFIERDQATGYLIANGCMIGPQQTLGSIATTFQLLHTEPDDAILPTHGRNDMLAVGYQNELLLVRGEDQIERIEFSSPIRQIVGSAPFTRTRLAVVTDNGTYVLWVQGRSTSQPIACGQDLTQPTAGFTLGGHLVLLARGGGEVYETTGAKLTLSHTFVNFNFSQLAVLPTSEPNEFGVITLAGNVSVHRLG